ncbi:hypothetical protein H4R24_003001 [Coemansia sp. RSA 988]|nr:hypothetical protein H4R24_003001 [Coemansia sp. RSA 988]
MNDSYWTMKLGHTVLGLAAGLSAVFASPTASNDNWRLFRRGGTEDMENFKGALLLKNGQQTSCEIALMYDTVGFVPANCLDYTDSAGKVLNTTTSYEVLISNGLTSAYGRFMATQMTVNPNYDPESFANNIAIIQFSGSGSGGLVNYIASWRPDWTNLYFVRRSVMDATSGMWNPPTLTPYNDNADLGDCARANPLFLYNQQDLICNQIKTASMVNRTCSMPYGSVYGVNDPNVAIAALYSHSAVYGDNGVCSNDKIYNYYIVMQNYVHWAMSVIGKKAPVFHTRVPEYTENLNPNYSMVVPNPKNVDGVTLLGGDLYHLNSTTATEKEDDDKKSGMSIGSIIGLVVGLLLLLALLAYFLRKKLLKKYADTRVRRWWSFGRFNKEERQEEFRVPAPDPNDPHQPSTYPVQF